MTMTRNNGDKGSHNYDGIGSLMGQGEMRRDAKELIDSGKTILDLFFRGDFQDDNQVRDVVLMAQQCIEFDMEDELETLKMLVAARAGIDGRRALMYLEGITGIILAEAHGKRGATKKDNVKKIDSQGNTKPAEV